jgi:hypothetical protein
MIDLGYDEKLIVPFVDEVPEMHESLSTFQCTIFMGVEPFNKGVSN